MLSFESARLHMFVYPRLHMATFEMRRGVFCAAELFHAARNEIRPPSSTQSAVWPLSEQQISAGDFIPGEIGFPLRGQIRARTPRRAGGRR